MDVGPSVPGFLSPAIGNLEKLSVLHLDFHEGNNIAGTLPPELGNCRRLTELIVNGHGNLTGE